MKRNNVVRRFRSLPRLHKILTLAFGFGILSICCLLPFAFADGEEETAGVGLVETIALPTQTKVDPTSTITTMPTKTNTVAVAVTATKTDTPADTVTPIPTQTQVVLNRCIPSNAFLQNAVVVNVIDGNTVDVNIGGVVTTVRYIGIDTPEMGDAHSQEASNRNSELVLGKKIILAKDVSETDQFQRLLRYVFADGVFVNEVLVQEGYASAKEYPPDTSCRDVLSAAQGMASSRSTGIWESPPTVEVVPIQPPVAGSSGCPTGCVEPKPGCEIKGNINSEGEKIYHDFSSSSYAKTKIDPSNGERWFCTADEAKANGWRAPRN